MTRRSSAKGREAAWWAAALVAAALAAGCDRSPPVSPADAPAADQPQRLPTATIRVAGAPLVVEVADEKAEHQKGMMFRRRLGPDEAMLFVFDRDDNLGFWMRNTFVDLDLAYIRSDGVVVQVERMRAHDPESVYSREPVRFALEVPAGWLEAHGVGVGARVEVPAEVAPRP